MRVFVWKALLDGRFFIDLSNQLQRRLELHFIHLIWIVYDVNVAPLLLVSPGGAIFLVQPFPALGPFVTHGNTISISAIKSVANK